MAMLVTEPASVLSTGVDNTRLEYSPYAIPNVTLQLKDGSRLYVPAHLLAKSETFSSPGQDGVYQLDISHDVAHVLVHYLFTENYQCLKPKGSSLNEKLAAEFITSIHVYIAAREYKLPLLEELAKTDIIKLGNDFRTPLVFDLVQKAYPSPSVDDTWFRQYLKNRLSILFTDTKELLEWNPIPDEKPTTISEMLLKNLLELLRENVISGDKTSNGILPQPHQSTAEGESEPAPTRQPVQLDESEKAHALVADAKVSNGPVKHEVEADNDKRDAADLDVGLDKGETSIAKSDSEVVKSDTGTSKSEDEITKNGAQTPVSKADSCEPEIVRVELPGHGLDHVVKPTVENKDEKDFWGLSLKKKKKKKATKAFVPEPLQEGVTVKS
ncbi:hypothetical protein BBK36DRAFT_1126082 [Trichoderma citrinoviride]|uniref:BTB domain-containing protein n=1 Tax=Trichoderma citrinoviride TaxID=58853 RepID=A0A2T4B2P6_9HYPO|nr:hypothetical protein BBK36DRAFT_1126082 [Trichoderma citrinoviride]PTB63597.1 hypothetical protein BBK36DRAFT_1126082 [Trichoderma citrinoviride]